MVSWGLHTKLQVLTTLVSWIPSIIYSIWCIIQWKTRKICCLGLPISPYFLNTHTHSELKQTNPLCWVSIICQSFFCQKTKTKDFLNFFETEKFLYQRLSLCSNNWWGSESIWYLGVSIEMSRSLNKDFGPSIAMQQDRPLPDFFCQFFPPPIHFTHF